jgi:hypothetical protein
MRTDGIAVQRGRKCSFGAGERQMSVQGETEEVYWDARTLSRAVS